MSVTTRPPASGGSRPDRLPRSQSSSSRGSEIRVGVLGVLGLLVLIVGVPLVLIVFVGYPLPRSAPSRDWLTTSISATLIINVLACVVWLVWAHFTVCLLTEWRAIRRGRLPSQVALGGGSQLLARRLVAAALLLSGAATAFAHSGAGQSGGPAHRPAAAVAGQRAGAAATINTPDAPSARDTATADTARSTEAKQAKYYTVQPPHGRRYDSLWDIADRTMNDPMRYKEIFALNHDRTQADGRKLIDANLIMPGWELRLPADASGPGVRAARTAVPTARAADAAEGAAANQATRGAHAAPETDRSVTAAPTAVGARPATALASPVSDDSTGSMLLGGALMLGGVLVALTARRGPYGEQTEEQTALGVGADPGLARLLDRALRNLGVSCAEQGRALPAPIAAWVSNDEIILDFVGGDVDQPPAPWQPRDGATSSWRCSVSDVEALDDVAAAAPFPGLLSVGTEAGYEVFVDFEQAPGIVGLGGELEQSRQFATALAVQAATSLWSDGARVTVVGFGDGAELARVEARAITQAPRLSDVLDSVEREHADVLRLQQRLGVDGVLTGRQARRTATWQPHLIFLSGPPTPDEASRLQPLVSGRSNVVVIVVGDPPAARWRFVVDGAGRIDLGVLGASAQAHRLTPDAVSHLADMVARAVENKRTTGDDVAALTPRQAVANLAPAPSSRPAVPAAATVALLGPVEVSAEGPLDPAKRDLLTEIAVAVALAPDGVHDAVLRASIWPRGVSDEVFTAAMIDTAAWLGNDSAGRRCLVEADGRWVASDAVRVDLSELRRLANASGPDEIDDLARAIALIRGEAFSATPPGRYRWLAFLSAGREARVVATAVVRRAARLFIESGRSAEAEAVLRQGLALVPQSELMWRDLLELASGRGPEPAVAVADEMYATLELHRVWAQPETDALVSQLAPGRKVSESA